MNWLTTLRLKLVIISNINSINIISITKANDHHHHHHHHSSSSSLSSSSFFIIIITIIIITIKMSSEQHTPVTHSSSNNFYIIWHKHVSTSTAELCYWYVINWHDLIYSRRHMRHVTSQTVSPKWALKITSLGGRKLGPQPQSSIVCGLCLVDLAPLYMTWPLFVEEENMTKMHSHTYMGISQHTYKIQFGSMQEKTAAALISFTDHRLSLALNWLWEGHTAYKMANLNWTEPLAPNKIPEIWPFQGPINWLLIPLYHDMISQSLSNK